MTFYDLTNTGAEIQEAITKALNSVDLDSAQDIEGIKNFVMGFQTKLEGIQLTDEGGNLYDYLTTRLEEKQDSLTFDLTPTSDSSNPVTSGGVYTAISNSKDAYFVKVTGTFSTGFTADTSYEDVVELIDDGKSVAFVTEYGTFTALPGVTLPVFAAGVYVVDDFPPKAVYLAYTSSALSMNSTTLQETLTFDTAPTSGSTNPVTSGGVYTAISNVSVDLSDYSTTSEMNTAISTAVAAIDLSDYSTTTEMNTAIASAVEDKADVSALASYTPTTSFATINGSTITAGGNVTIAATEQTITIDAAPTEGSSNAVSSGGVYSELDGGYYY